MKFCVFYNIIKLLGNNLIKISTSIAYICFIGFLFVMYCALFGPKSW
jgi:hypothetical protein